MREYSEGIAAGQYTYPFVLYLPQWLPQTQRLQNRHKDSNLVDQFRVEYTVRAQFVTKNPADMKTDSRFPGKFKDVSFYRGWREVLVYRPVVAQAPEILFVKSMTHSTGGIIGMGSQKSTTKVIVRQNCVRPGEKFKVTLEYDGSICVKKVKSFKF